MLRFATQLNPQPQGEVPLKGKETEVELKMKKRHRQRQKQRLSGSDTKVDRLSDLPDSVLLHIMKFLNTKDAVKTCLLSKRWKDLWKSLPDLTLHSTDFSRLAFFEKFVYGVLAYRDCRISLHSFDFSRHGCIQPTFLNGVIGYAVSHNVMQLTIHANIDVSRDFKLPHYIFSCQSLTFLKLSVRSICRLMAKIPKSLELPALKTLHLVNVTFKASENDRTPFSTCNMLNTLIIDHFALRHGTDVLCISNSNLSSLTILDTFKEAHKIELATPNLRSLTITIDPIHKLTACNLPFLEEVNISCRRTDLSNGLALISWLQVANNVKMMTLCSRTLEILNDFSTLDSTIQPPCFGRLKSLKVKMNPHTKLSDEGVSKTVACLLQNSPLPRADIMNCRT